MSTGKGEEKGNEKRSFDVSQTERQVDTQRGRKKEREWVRERERERERESERERVREREWVRERVRVKERESQYNVYRMHSNVEWRARLERTHVRGGHHVRTGSMVTIPEMKTAHKKTVIRSRRRRTSHGYITCTKTHQQLLSTGRRESTVTAKLFWEKGHDLQKVTKYSQQSRLECAAAIHQIESPGYDFINTSKFHLHKKPVPWLVETKPTFFITFHSLWALTKFMLPQSATSNITRHAIVHVQSAWQILTLYRLASQKSVAGDR